jgi:hypothetical protein
MAPQNYLCLSKDYTVHGLIRRSSSFNTAHIDHLHRDLYDPQTRIFLHFGGLSASAQLMDLLHSIKSEEIYHSHVRVSFDIPEYTGGHYWPRNIARSRSNTKNRYKNKTLSGIIQRNIRHPAPPPQK